MLAHSSMSILFNYDPLEKFPLIAKEFINLFYSSLVKIYFFIYLFFLLFF